MVGGLLVTHIDFIVDRLRFMSKGCHIIVFVQALRNDKIIQAQQKGAQIRFLEQLRAVLLQKRSRFFAHIEHVNHLTQDLFELACRYQD